MEAGEKWRMCFARAPNCSGSLIQAGVELEKYGGVCGRAGFLGNNYVDIYDVHTILYLNSATDKILAQ